MPTDHGTGHRADDDCGSLAATLANLGPEHAPEHTADNLALLRMRGCFAAA
jgi:hypothetical protein